VIKNTFQYLHQRRLTLTFLLIGMVILLFIFIPLGRMIFSSNPSVLWNTLLDKEVRDSIWLSIYTALIATSFGLFFGVPLAYFLARHSFPGKRLVEALIDVPIVVPHIAAGIALLFVFGKNYFGGKAFDVIGIDFRDAVPGIIKIGRAHV
jgi:molybdate/tungstate transport system permease protein